MTTEQKHTPETDVLDEEATKPSFEFNEDSFDKAIALSRKFEQQCDELAEALRLIVDYVAVNEMTVSPAFPVAPQKMKAIARAALAKLS